MAWIELHQAVWTHRKTTGLAESLGITETYAAAHVIRVWTWALDNATDGALRCSDRVIARAADWGGDPETFVRALALHGWLDLDGEHYVIHDWGEYAGRLIDRREQDKERKRRIRSEIPPGDEPVRRMSGGRPPDVLRTVPNRTQHNRTGPDQETHEAADAAVPALGREPPTDLHSDARDEYPPSETPKAKPVDSGNIAALFGEYQVRVQPKAKLTDDARRKIATRLRTWTTEELRAAIVHFAADPWQMEHNSHRGATWFFATDSRIEQYVNLAPKEAKHGAADRPARRPDSGLAKYAAGPRPQPG